MAVGGCDEGHHSVFDGRTPTGDRIATLGWIMIAIAAVVFVLVLVLLGRVLLGRRGPGASTPDAPGDPWSPPERRFLLSSKGWILAGGVVLPTVVVLVLSGLTVDTLSADPGRPDLEIRVVGEQYWWRVQYPAAGATAAFETANEIHVPVRRATELHLEATDVIHDLWVPELGPKRDMIPGRPTTLVWKPESTGTFRGQCAEFCGLQHANMALRVIVQSDADFQAWAAAQAAPAAAPTGDQATKGQQAFLDLACSACHQIRGVNSVPTGVVLRDGGLVTGPDLTHVASRPELAAETIPNEPDELAQWLSDAQLAKPGNRMPPVAMTDDDLAALVAYLEGLR
jgi:cytochrome c oxidase subunit 2